MITENNIKVSKHNGSKMNNSVEHVLVLALLIYIFLQTMATKSHNVNTIKAQYNHCVRKYDYSGN